MRIAWVTCLVFQPKNHKPLRIFFCRHLFLRRGGSQFTQFYHCRNVIFFHNQPLFSNFQLFRALKTQLTFMSVGEPDYAMLCCVTSGVLFWCNRVPPQAWATFTRAPNASAATYSDPAAPATLCLDPKPKLFVFLPLLFNGICKRRPSGWLDWGRLKQSHQNIKSNGTSTMQRNGGIHMSNVYKPGWK